MEAALGVTPTVDGDVIPTTVQQALLAGSFAKNVDVLVGTNQNEGTTFVYAIMNKTLSKLEYVCLCPMHCWPSVCDSWRPAGLCVVAGRQVRCVGRCGVGQ